MAAPRIFSKLLPTALLVLSAVLVLTLLVLDPPVRPIAPAVAATPDFSADDLAEVEDIDLATLLLAGSPATRANAFGEIARRDNPGFVAPILEFMRFFGAEPIAIETLEAITGDTPGDDWHAWQLWLEAHPETPTLARFDEFKSAVFAHIDPNFRLFIHKLVKHEIRLEEIVWGGVVKDGIPALIDPAHVPASEATYLSPDEFVFGVAINGDARAYPLRILDWHEMFNDVVGGVPVALAYCTLCGSGILYETMLEGRRERTVFGSSGFLYRSNKLMYDHATNSLWNQFTGRPVVGPLTGSGIELTVRPVVITTWTAWRERHPDTKVLSIETGYDRDYRPGRPYGSYFSSPDLMFPAMVTDTRLAPKDHIFVLRDGGAEKSWPVAMFETEPVLNDTVGGLDVVLVGDAASRTVRAFDAGGHDFTAGPTRSELSGPGGTWTVEEDALVGPAGERLRRLGGHVAYWFAFQNFRPDGVLGLN